MKLPLTYEQLVDCAGGVEEELEHALEFSRMIDEALKKGKKATAEDIVSGGFREEIIESYGSLEEYEYAMKIGGIVDKIVKACKKLSPEDIADADYI